MPTMPKLFAAVLVAILGYVVADLVAGHLPPEVAYGKLGPMSVVFGILVGWRFLGKRAGLGVRSGVGLGLTAAVALVASVLIFFAGVEMIRRSLRKAYGGNPFEALQDMMQIAIDYTVHLAYGDVIGAIVVGGMIVGVMVELVARRWS